MPAMKIQFLGAAQSVTGSSYLLDSGEHRLLVDCGIHQERQHQDRNWNPFPVPPASIDAVVLTHAHLDHCGLLPKLVREGFRGPVYGTSATVDIARIVIADSARIQEEDAEFKRRRHAREGRTPPHPVTPLYTVSDAERAMDLLSPVPYGTAFSPAPGFETTLFNAGHILGSSSVRISMRANGTTVSVLLSGDIGRYGAPILADPSPDTAADVLVMESTYGDKVHDDNTDIPDRLSAIINETRRARGNIVIPAFAVERTQDILYHLNRLLQADRIPHLRVFVDSPMAVQVTEVFRRHPELFDREASELLREGIHPCDFPGLTLSRTVAESKSINHIGGTVIIMAGSGMCNAGRIKHHLANNITREESTILFVGYQAVGTLGRSIVDGAREVRILGQLYPVHARVERIDGFSAHAGQDELLRWLSSLQAPPKRVFVTHGEPDVSTAFAQKLVRERGLQASAPDYREEVRLA